MLLRRYHATNELKPIKAEPAEAKAESNEVKAEEPVKAKPRKGRKTS